MNGFDIFTFEFSGRALHKIEALTHHCYIQNDLTPLYDLGEFIRGSLGTAGEPVSRRDVNNFVAFDCDAFFERLGFMAGGF